MRVFVSVWTGYLLIVVTSLVASIAIQLRWQRAAAKNNAQLRQQLEAQAADTTAYRERSERRTHELRDSSHELVELRRKEIALREEQAVTLHRLVTIHEELLTALRGRV
jgi:flagellar biosynthesis/type III secretory pathway M-ring protein FliF/YscJ